MMNRLTALACALAFAICAGTDARADVRIKQKVTVGGHTMESDVAIKGQRQRTESEMAPGMKTVQIMQCDLRRMLQVSDATRKYTVTPLGGGDPTEASRPATPAPATSGVARRGGVVTYTTTMTDTGERKQMFGFTARRIKSSMRMEASPDACQKDGMNIETDGWYIDFDFQFSCPMDGSQAMTQIPARPDGCQDQVRFRSTGTAKLGYPVQTTTRMLDMNGRELSSTSTEVTSLTRATLDAALFDVPAGYVETKNAQELYDTAAMMRAAQSARSNDDDNAAGRRDGPMNVPATSSPGAKRAGVIRVGVVALNNRTDKTVETEQLRRQLIAELTGATVEAVALDTSSPEEARQKECDFILSTDISALKQSAANKIGGMFGRAAGVGGAAERFEAKVEYTLVPASGGAALVQSNASAKEEGGADASLSAALRKEAQAVLAKVRK
ncbi:MAG TPA: hypothetical protein VF240_04410 [Pyrinomonadaceae bacterium]